MLSIFFKEIDSFLNSLIAYIVIGVFLVGMGLFIWVFPETSVLNYGFAEMDTLFSFGPYIFMFLIPAITMKMFAEEKKTGTIEILLSQPLSDFQIILGKYLAAWVLVLLALIPTLIYYLSIYQLGNPVGNIDSAAVLGSYAGLFLLGGGFTSIGLLASSITDSQIIAFILSAFVSFICYSGLSSLAGIDVWAGASSILEQTGMNSHYEAMSRGLVDSRDLIYFFSFIGLMLFSTHLILGSRKW